MQPNTAQNKTYGDPNVGQLTFYPDKDGLHEKAYLTFLFDERSSPSTHLKAFVKRTKTSDKTDQQYLVALENPDLSVYDSEKNTTTATFFNVDEAQKTLGIQGNLPTPDQYLIGPLNYTQANSLLKVFREATAIRHFQHEQKAAEMVFKELLPIESSWKSLITGFQTKIKSGLNL